MATGLRRALASPVMLLWLWLVNVAVAAPAAWVVAGAIEDGIGASRVHEGLRDGFDMAWYTRFEQQAEGLAATFSPTHAGVGAVLDNLETWVGGGSSPGPPAVLAAGAAYALLWLLMLGGVIDRFADREERPSVRRFFESGRKLFFRFVRLALLSGGLYACVYWLMFRTLKWIARKTEDVTVEATILYYGLLVFAGTALLLTVIHACFGFAKVATVVDGRRSMLLAAVRGFVFVFTHPAKAAGLYYGFLLLSGLLLGLYAVLAPGIGQSTWKAVAWAFVWGQAFLILKMYVRLSLLAGQTALYQRFGVAQETAPSPPAAAVDGGSPQA
jgi:hypothetical protein